MCSGAFYISIVKWLVGRGRPGSKPPERLFSESQEDIVSAKVCSYSIYSYSHLIVNWSLD